MSLEEKWDGHWCQTTAWLMQTLICTCCVDLDTLPFRAWLCIQSPPGLFLSWRRSARPLLNIQTHIKFKVRQSLTPDHRIIVATVTDIRTVTEAKILDHFIYAAHVEIRYPLPSVFTSSWLFIWLLLCPLFLLATGCSVFSPSSSSSSFLTWTGPPLLAVTSAVTSEVSGKQGQRKMK